ncbi:MAG: OmpA family protein [Polyangiales bacterium]
MALMFATLAGCTHAGPSPLLTLRRVVLNQSGSGYFERSGTVAGDRLALRLKSHEVNDVLATLTVLEQGPGARQTVVAAGVPHATEGNRDETVNLDLRLPDARARDLLVAYAVPTANWQATYRVVLPEHDGAPALLQIWALVHNSSDENWDAVEMTLATGAPLSFSLNLRTPSFTARPDATGQLSTPTANGPVLSEQTRDDGDARQRFASNDRGGAPAGGDGSPGGDADHDGIPDARDTCPSEAETYNGQEDSDGCPDTGRVAVENAQLRILHMVNFDANASTVLPRMQPVIDALASVLRATPSVRSLEIQGNASADERDAWSLALERAATVRARLIAAGIEADRLRVRSYGATRPLASGASAEERARNRYVGFHLDVAEEGRRETHRGAVTVRSLSTSAPDNASAHEFMGATRFVVSAPVSITAGSAALVTIASREVPGEDVYLFRPESAAPASREHPYRAARLRNRTGMTLLPGPVALFSGGTFAGQGLLGRLHDDETTFVPYAIDPSTNVEVTHEDATEPSRLVSVTRAAVTLEDTSVHRTRFRVEPGAQAPSRIFLRHELLDGYTPRALPPESEAGRGADLIPVPITARRESVVTVEQTRPATRTLSLLDDVTTDLAPYLRAVPEAVRQQLASVVDQRNALARAEREADELREQLSDVAERNAELRETLQTLQTATDATRVALRNRLTAQLQESMTRYTALSRDLSTRTATASTLRSQLIDALRGLRVTVDAPAAAPAADAS